MPPYWRQTFYRRRYRPFTWRARRTFQRRKRWRRYTKPRKTYWRRKLRVRRRFYKRKLKKIVLKQFQPKIIRRCTIFGTICLFQGSPERANNNYIQTIYSYVPDKEPGGGGWTLITESLSSLWEDWEHLKNVWTNSNAGLPLVRYGGVTLFFYQSAYTDYIAQIFNCYPMTDTKYTHADSAPNRMLLKKHVIRVPSRETRKKRKPYKRVRVGPPSQMQNKWYFQRDICDIPLIMIAATAVDFRYPFCGSDCASNNLTLTCLNPLLFQNQDFDHPSDTQGYFPKPGVYLYSTQRTQQPSVNDCIYLGNTKDNQEGKSANSLDMLKSQKITDWGNPFWHYYIDGSKKIFSYFKPPSQLQQSDFSQMTELAEPMFIQVRYNPERDTGEGNLIYITENFRGQHWDPPASDNLKLDGFPLFDMCWGFIDWIEKVHETENLLTNYCFCIRTNVFNEKKTVFIPVDHSFLTGFSPYETSVKTSDRAHWHPQIRFQTKSINDICLTGPGCPRSPYGNYMQAKMSYKFHLKWGGCPKTYEKPYDPCSQPNWTIPHNLNETIQIQNPNTCPQTELQEWDWRRDIVTKKAIERIRQHTEPHETLQISTGSKHNPPILRQTPPWTDSETDSEEEKDQTQEIQIQLNKLRKHQQHLKQQLKQYLKPRNIE